MAVYGVGISDVVMQLFTCHPVHDIIVACNNVYNANCFRAT